MDSLRRLTSSVFDGHSRLGGGGRRNSGSGSAISAFLGGSVGADPASALDLTLITDRLLVSGFPVLTSTDKKANETNVDELAAYLETHYSNHYLIFNLNALDDIDNNSSSSTTECASPVDTQRISSSASLMDQLLRKPQQQAVGNGHDHSARDAARVIADKVREQMLEFSWERDGMKAHTPPFDLIFRICYSIFAWLSLDSQNVAVVHCQTGKTRSGVVVACYLLFARLADDPIDAFVEFYRKRWEMKTLTAEALRNKTPPSIQRFLASFHELIEYQKPPNAKPLLLKAIICRALPVELQPCIQIWDDYKMIFCTDSMLGGTNASGSKDAPVLDWNGDDGFLAILWENGITLDGGFSILCSFGDEYDNGDDVDASSRVLFRYADSTWFLNPGLVTLTKGKLDMMKQYEHGFDDDMFSVDLVVHENSTKARKNYVRLDYTGNNAVRQGLIEITKHHLVLPDPAMHSNFIRMGFGETPTTFALQRSQNTPNVALDLLHSEGLAACFVNESSSPGKEELQSAGMESAAAMASRDQMPAGEPTMNPQATALRRQTTAEIVAMQSQRSRYSTPTAAADTSSTCQVCKEDDYMMRPQIVRCSGKCGSFYHTTCVGLKKIPFGLTTLSDRTNHGVYVKKFFSAWECDSCALPPTTAVGSESSTAVEIPAGMTLVPSSWASSYAPSSSATAVPAAQSEPSTNGDRHSIQSDRTRSSSNLVASGFSAQPISSESVKLDKLRDFLQTSGVSVEDLLRAATTANVSIAPNGENSPQKLAIAENGGATPLDSSPGTKNHSQTHASGISHSHEPLLVDYGKSQTPERMADVSSSKYAELQPPFHLHQSPNSKHQSAPVPAVESGLGRSEVENAAHIKESASSPQPVANGFGSNVDLLKQIKARSSTELSPTHAPPPDPKAAMLKGIMAKRKKDDSEADSTNNGDSSAESAVQLSKYEMMLKRGVPFDAVQNCMTKDGVDPSTLRPLDPSTRNESLPDVKIDPAVAKLRLKDVDEFQSYFNMMRLGCQKEAVKQKLIMDGLDPIILDLGPDAIYDDVKFKITIVQPVEERSRLQDDIKSVREPRSQRSRPASEQEASERPGLEPQPAAKQEQKEHNVAGPGDVLLKDHEVYAKYFKMLKMGLPEDAVRHKIKSEGADERALELGGDALFSKLMEVPVEVKLGDDPLYSKYYKMLKMGLPEGAVRHKMVTDGADPRALELGADALVSALTKTSAVKPVLQGLKPKQRRKKLHWQAISDDRLSSINQQTIWEDKGDDGMEFDMDMDELESLFFSNNDANANSTGSNGGKKKGTQGKALKRKQSVTLVDGKRAMNAAISLARVKLSYREIAQGVSTFDPKGLSLEQLIGINDFLPTPEEVALVSAYTGDVAMLGEVRTLCGVLSYQYYVHCHDSEWFVWL